MIKSWFLDENGALRSYVAWVLGVLAVGALAYGAYAYWSRDSRVNKVSMMCMTAGCTYTREESLQEGETLPSLCPKCNQKSVVPSFKCTVCGTNNVWNEDRGLKPPTKCTKCGKEYYHGK